MTSTPPTPRLLGALLLLTAALVTENAMAAMVSVQRAPGEDITFYWSGLCDDCAGSIGDELFEAVSGSLSLTNFIPDVTLISSNFVSFSYNGSSLIDPFIVDAGDVEHIEGTLGADGP